MLAQVSQLALCKRLAVGMRVSHYMWQCKLEVCHGHGGVEGDGDEGEFNNNKRKKNRKADSCKAHDTVPWTEGKKNSSAYLKCWGSGGLKRRKAQASEAFFSYLGNVLIAERHTSVPAGVLDRRLWEKGAHIENYVARCVRISLLMSQTVQAAVTECPRLGGFRQHHFISLPQFWRLKSEIRVPAWLGEDPLPDSRLSVSSPGGRSKGPFRGHFYRDTEPTHDLSTSKTPLPNTTALGIRISTQECPGDSQPRALSVPAQCLPQKIEFSPEIEVKSFSSKQIHCPQKQ